MSGLASNFISPTIDPDGTKRKDITYFNEDKMTRSVTNILGQTISIHHIGRLEYECKPSAGGSIYRYHIIIKENEKILMDRKVFSDIDLNKIGIGNIDYEDAVANTLLTVNNIEFSQAYGYVGELEKKATLPDGQERMQSDYYIYKIPNNSHTLRFTDVHVEAAKSFQLQEQAKEQAKERAKQQEQAKEQENDDGPELS